MTDRQRERYKDYKLAYEAFMKFYPLSTDDLPHEVWKDIMGYEGLYQVSTYGRVKSFKWGKERILKPALLPDGYLRVELHKNGKQQNLGVHRLVALMFVPNPGNLPEVDHVYGIKFDCSVYNLRWVTKSENVKYTFENGRQAIKGEEVYNAKLTSEQVVFIRENPDNLSIYKLAEKFNIPPTSISDIQLGKKYKNAGGTIRSVKMLKKPRTSDDVREEICRLFIKGSKTFGARPLGRKFNLDPTTILNIVREGRQDYQAKPKAPRVSDEIRAQIKTEYVKGSKEFGCYGLAEKYGVWAQTIWYIVNEK
ncbi:MAG: NUMOD4 motif-containing HNH endonuclease [Selenomonadaceae bacterium]|nr:NUMOD4 motif-containing HNH endonuclease [Selenomonadaceae bacterium]